MEQRQPDRPQEDDSQHPTDKGLATRYRKWAERWGPRIAILIFALMFIAIALFNRIFVFIEPGEQGVLYRRLGIPTLSTGGTDLDNAYLEGMNIKMPYNDMVVYNVRAQQVHDEFNVLSSDGLSIKLEVSIRYRPRRDALPLLHVEVGPEYVDTVVKPEVQANLRILMGGYTPSEIYTSQGYLIRRTVENAMPELLERHIILDDLLIKAITLPPTVQDSIESKLRQQQAYLEYEFRLKREEKERDRKLIEAEGIKLF
ncbi:prohibitin family protein, partial [Verrucomicrobia bacterium]|nr:prohibitin family protein [Verrucomicrobiota bacterium]